MFSFLQLFQDLLPLGLILLLGDEPAVIEGLELRQPVLGGLFTAALAGAVLLLILNRPAAHTHLPRRHGKLIDGNTDGDQRPENAEGTKGGDHHKQSDAAEDNAYDPAENAGSLTGPVAHTPSHSLFLLSRFRGSGGLPCGVHICLCGLLVLLLVGEGDGDDLVPLFLELHEHLR